MQITRAGNENQRQWRRCQFLKTKITPMAMSRNQYGFGHMTCDCVIMSMIWKEMVRRVHSCLRGGGSCGGSGGLDHQNYQVGVLHYGVNYRLPDGLFLRQYLCGCILTNITFGGPKPIIWELHRPVDKKNNLPSWTEKTELRMFSNWEEFFV